jgi:hypothetical protein
MLITLSIPMELLEPPTIKAVLTIRCLIGQKVSLFTPSHVHACLCMYTHPSALQPSISKLVSYSIHKRSHFVTAEEERSQGLVVLT